MSSKHNAGGRGSAHDDMHKDALNETGFWGRQAAGCLILANTTRRLCIARRGPKALEPLTWGTWGGAVDPHEAPEDAVRREIVEEAGYRSEVELTPLLVFNHHSGFQYHNFLATVPDEFTPQLDWETCDWVWCAFNEWPRPLHPGLITLLADAASLQAIRRAIDDCAL